MIVEAGANITARKKRVRREAWQSNLTLWASGTATSASALQGIDLYLWEFNIPLLEAAKNGHVDVVSFLISLPRMDVNARYYMVGGCRVLRYYMDGRQLKSPSSLSLAAERRLCTARRGAARTSGRRGRAACRGGHRRRGAVLGMCKGAIRSRCAELLPPT